MAMTPAEKQRRYRERLKAKAAAGDEKAVKQLTKKRDTRAEGFSRAKTFIKLHATRSQLDELNKMIQKKLKNNLQ